MYCIQKNLYLMECIQRVVTMTKDEVKVEKGEAIKYLFTTSTCPNCKIAKEMLKGEEYQLVDAEKNPEMAARYGIDAGSYAGDYQGK